MSVHTFPNASPPPAHASGSLVALRALALLRKFEKWEARVRQDGEDVAYLNGTAWDDLEEIADHARVVLAWLRVPDHD